MPRQPIIVRITAVGAPRDTLVLILSRSRNGRGKASMLTKTPSNGFYYAVIDHPDTAITFQVALTTLCIEHAEVAADAAGLRIQATPAITSSASGARMGTGTIDGTFRRAWTGDTQVDTAISDWLVDMFTPKDFLGRPRTNGSS